MDQVLDPFQVAQSTLPIEGVAHLNGHQHRQRHRGWVARFKDFTVDAFKDGVVFGAPHEVPLQRSEHRYEGAADFLLESPSTKRSLADQLEFCMARGGAKQWDFIICG